MAREDPQLKLRLPTPIKALVEDAATKNNRSVNAEIVHRLEESFSGNTKDELLDYADALSDRCLLLMNMESGLAPGLARTSNASDIGYTRFVLVVSEFLAALKKSANLIMRNSKITEEALNYVELPLETIAGPGFQKLFEALNKIEIDLKVRETSALLHQDQKKSRRSKIDSQAAEDPAEASLPPEPTIETRRRRQLDLSSAPDRDESSVKLPSRPQRKIDL